jgi:hypothetical protein
VGIKAVGFEHRGVSKGATRASGPRRAVAEI